jgi:hypothetical protein
MPETPVKKLNAAVAGPAGDQLQVSLYDRASSMLLALLVTFGAVAVLLFIVWLTGKVIDPPLAPPAPHFVELTRDGGENGGDRQAPGGTQLDTPSDEPSFGKKDETPDVEEQLNRFDAAAVSKADDSFGTGGGKYGGTGSGKGWGDQRDRPPGSPPPPARHWEVLFSKSTLDAYAKQLDFFRIELGVLLPDNKIVCVYNLTKSKPDTRTVANPASEDRYYLTWRSGEMQQADRDLLARAGVDVGDALIVKFLPPQVEEQLAELERGYARTDAKRIQRTRFGVRPEGAGFAIFVLEQSLKRY